MPGAGSGDLSRPSKHNARVNLRTNSDINSDLRYPDWISVNKTCMTINSEWQLTDNAAVLYERYLVPIIFVPWAQYLLANHVPKIGSNVLDAACGTGIVGRMAKARVGATGRVVGVDLNAGMLAVAREASSAAGDNIEWIEAEICQVPLGDNSFDIAYCQQGLQFFPDKVAALQEIRRLLKPGSKCIVVVAQSLDHNPLMSSQVNALTKHIGEDAAAGIRAVCNLSNKEEITELFEKAGYVEVEAQTVDLTLTHPDGREFIKYGILSTPIAGIISNWSDNERNNLVNDILSGFGQYFDGQSLIFPHVANVVSGVVR